MPKHQPDLKTEYAGKLPIQFDDQSIQDNQLNTINLN